MLDWICTYSVSLWAWLLDASPGQATFLGTLTGSSIGLFALLLGALFNAHLNPRRDDRLRREDRAALTAALLAELGGFRDRLQSNLGGLKEAAGEERYLTRRMPSRSALPPRAGDT
jgi:hypothetical protein